MTLAIEAPAALLVCGAALCRTAAGDPAPLHAIDGTGRRVSFDPGGVVEGTYGCQSQNQ